MSAAIALCFALSGATTAEQDTRQVGQLQIAPRQVAPRHVAPSLSLDVFRAVDGSPAETISFHASRHDESRVISPQQLRLRLDPPLSAWRLLIHTGNEFSDTPSLGNGANVRGLRNSSDQNLGADLLWRRADGAIADCAPEPDFPRPWHLMRDPLEPAWADISSSADVTIDPQSASESYLLEFAAQIDAISPGTYSTRILIDLLCYSPPDPEPEPWIRILSLGSARRRRRGIQGNAVSLFAGYDREISSVRFEYRSVPGEGTGESPWTPCATTFWSDANPDTMVPRWGILWDIAALATGLYDVRAVASRKTGGSGFQNDPYPEIRRVEIQESDRGRHDNRHDRDANFTERQWAGDDEDETIALFDGTCVRIPRGSWMSDDSPANAWIHISHFAELPPGTTPARQYRAVRRGFRRIEREDGGHAFHEPVTIEIPYRPEDIDAPEKRLGLYWFDPAALHWVLLDDSRVDTERRVVVARTNHFSDFAILARSLSVDPQDVLIYPNPYVPDDRESRNGTEFKGGDLSTGVIFDGLEPGCVIHIRTVSGREVIQLSNVRFDGRIQWDARAADGRMAASGIYIVVIRSPSGATALKKLMIIR